MRTALLVIISLLFISCSSKEEPNKKNYKNNNTAKKSFNFQKSVPNWIFNPNLGVKYGAVGIAQNQNNKKLQRLSAIANGKRKLSELFRVQLQKQTPMPLDTNSKMIGSTFNIVALESSENIVKDASVKASYTDDKGTLYLWIVIY